MVVEKPICIDCKLLDLKKEVNGKAVCKAYPNGIPDEVIEKKCKPNVSVETPCNNGYKFEPT